MHSFSAYLSGTLSRSFHPQATTSKLIIAFGVLHGSIDVRDSNASSEGALWELGGPEELFKAYGIQLGTECNRGLVYD